MTRLRDRNEDLEARAVRHAARIEDLEDQLAATRRRIRVLETEHAVQAGIIRRRNAQLVQAAEQMTPRLLDTGTPGVEVSR